MSSHKEIDYYYKNQFIFKLGYVNHTKASKPLSLHAHKEKTEFIFMVKGSQNYIVDDKQFFVQSGDIFKILPGELHSTGNTPEQKSEFYYMSIDLNAAIEHELLCLEKDSGQIQNWHQKRCWKIHSQAYNYCHDILRICIQKHGMWETEVRNRLSDLFILMYQENTIDSEMNESNIEKAIEYIETHIRENITIEQLIEISGFSRSRFHHYFLKNFGIPPKEYVLQRKVEIAKKELKETDKSVTEIAHDFDFSSSQYFSTVFKRYCYMTPSQFRENMVISNNEEAYYE